ncbi:MAG: glycosyltransferase [Cyanophyceae cyanobacterium]
MMKAPKRFGHQQKCRWLHLWLLLCGLIVGVGLRCTQLDAKPPWSDEWATIVFSLGHRFSTVPLNEVISLETLLLPMRLNAAQDSGDVVAALINDSTHPPLYFIVNHWWLKLFSPPSELVSIWSARSLSALLGAAAILAMFGLGWLVFRSRLVGQMAAALMAVSPYGIYLSQEARHYTLAILWAIASLGCLVIAVRHRRQPTSRWLMLFWIGVNSLGFATHYFFLLALAAQGLVLLALWLRQWQRDRSTLISASWQRIYAAITGTTIGILVWLPALVRIPGNNLTSWIYEGNPWEEFLGPFGRLLVWLTTMLFLLPVEGTPLPLTILSGVVVLLVLLWLMPKFVTGLRAIQKQHRVEIQTIGGYIIASSLIIVAITYFLGADLTAAARFQFTTFPAVVLLLGAILAKLWQGDRPKIAVIVTLIMGLFGALTVVSNLGYQKFERPDLVVPQIVENTHPSESLLIAIAHKSHGQTAELLGLAWQFQQRYPQFSPFFLFVHQEPDAQAASVQQAIAQLPQPVQLWLVNFADPPQLERCTPEKHQRVPGYRYQLYRCRE